MRDSDAGTEGERCERCESKPPRVDETCAFMQPVEKPIGIHCREKDLGQVAIPAFCFQELAPLFGTLLHQADVFFLRRLVPELCCLQVVCEFPDGFQRVRGPRLTEVELGYLLASAH